MDVINRLWHTKHPMVLLIANIFSESLQFRNLACTYDENASMELFLKPCKVASMHLHSQRKLLVCQHTSASDTLAFTRSLTEKPEG